MSGTSEYSPFWSSEQNWLDEIKDGFGADFYKALKKVLDKLIVDICYKLDYHAAGDTEIDEKSLSELKDALKKINVLLNKLKIKED